MLSIYDLKEQAVTDTPLLLFDCVLANGQAESWSTHQVTYNGKTYAPRVMKHNLLEVQTSSDQGVDVIPRVSLGLANADSYFSELQLEVGWKGATLTVTFLYVSLLRSANELTDIQCGGGVSRHRQPAGQEHGIALHTLGDQPDEPTASAVAAGTDTASLPVVVSLKDGAEAGSGIGRKQRAVFAVLQLRLLAGHAGWCGIHDRWHALHCLRVHADRL
jgi:hypothetical protein